MKPQQKSAQTRARKKQEAFLACEETAKAALITLGYGPRYYAGKCHAIKGLKPGEFFYQEQSPGGYDSWQEALKEIEIGERWPNN